MKFLKYPLLPFSLLYAGITRTRNWLYDSQILSSHQFQVPVINVGNLTVGGTGKTPHVEYLVRLLRKQNIAILSRGYKRKTTGFVLADQQASAATIGDEPYQYFSKFPEVIVAVCEDRVAGIQQLLRLNKAISVILLDDAFQHRPVQAALNMLITDYNRLFFQDFVLPAGRLREDRAGACRADIILVSKCPDLLPLDEQENIKRSINKYSKPGTPVFFTSYAYLQPIAFGNRNICKKKIILVTGIAQTEPLVQYLAESRYELIRHFKFADHHTYTQQDILEIANFARTKAGDKASILTTQKDWTKLNSPIFLEQVQHLPLFYLPIEVKFLKNQELFDAIILKTAIKIA